MRPAGSRRRDTRRPAFARAGAGLLLPGLVASIAVLMAVIAARGGGALSGELRAAEVPRHGGLPVAYPNAPPPGFTGGFGETSCDACHFEAEPNQPPGQVTLLGVPDRFEAGQAYDLTVVLTRPGMARGGFELAARFANGDQAGRLAAGDSEAGRVGVTSAYDVQYAHHLLAGTTLVAQDTARWSLVWTAPDGAGTVHFHVAANAADGDDAVYGDYIYTTTAVTQSRD